MNEYRSWDNRRKVMIEWDTIKSQRLLHNLMDDPNVTLMQNTGIIDSNKNYIYDKDIVTVTLKDDNGIIYENKSGIVRYYDFEWGIDMADEYWPVVSWSLVQSATVLTNVYELHMLMTPYLSYTD